MPGSPINGNERASLDRGLFYALLPLLVFLPLPYGSNRPMYWAFSEIYVFSLFTVWLLTIASPRALLQPAVKVARWAILSLAGVCLWLLLQATATGPFDSIDSHATWSQLVRSASLLCLFLLTLALVNSRRRIRIFAWVLLLSGTFQAVYGTLGAINEHTTATGTFVNRNHLAGYLEMTLAVGLGLLIADLSRDAPANWRQNVRHWINTLLGPKARVRICLALMVIGLILTQSRMGNAAFFTAMMIAGIVGLYIFRRSSRAIILLFSSLIAIDTLLMGAFFGIDKLQQRIEQTDLSTDDRVASNIRALEFLSRATTSVMDLSHRNGNHTTAAGISTHDASATATAGAQISTRSGGRKPAVELTPPSFDLPLRTLLLGSGAGTYYTIFPLYRDESVQAQIVHAHNDFLEFALEFGAIGSLMLIAFVGLALHAAIRAQTRRHSRLTQAMGFTGMMAIFSLMIHSSADFNLQIYANALTYVAVLALPFIAIATHRQIEDVR